MATGEILINVVDGRRRPADPATRLLVTASDGDNRTVVRRFVTGSAVHLAGLEVRDSLADRHTILVSARDCADSGFTPVLVTAHQQQVLDLMLIRRAADFAFEPFNAVAQDADLLQFLQGESPGGAQALYEGLALRDAPALACLLNITTALSQLALAPFEGVDRNPLRSCKALRSAHPDRMFAWIDARVLPQIAKTLTSQARDRGLSRLAKAPEGLHPGATVSYKQTDFGEGNIQLSFHEHDTRAINGVACMLVDLDIDYVRDAAAHLLMEVFPNRLKSLVRGRASAQSLTDPRLVYGLRWVAGRRKRVEFAPPYALE